MHISFRHIVILTLLLFQGAVLGEGFKKVLNYQACGGYCHNKRENSGMPSVKRFIDSIAGEKGWEVRDISESNHPFFSSLDSLSQYQLIVLNNVTHIHKTLESEQRDNIETWYKNGGKIMVFHATLDHGCGKCEEWPWWLDFIVVDEQGHTVGGTEGLLRLDEDGKNHMIGEGFPEEGIVFKEEWYGLSKNIREVDGVTVILNLDEENSPGKEDLKIMGDHPVSWVREFQGSRSFVSSLGHNHVPLKQPAVVRHFAKALDWLENGDSPSNTFAPSVNANQPMEKGLRFTGDGLLIQKPSAKKNDQEFDLKGKEVQK